MHSKPPMSTPLIRKRGRWGSITGAHDVEVAAPHACSEGRLHPQRSALLDWSLSKSNRQERMILETAKMVKVRGDDLAVPPLPSAAGLASPGTGVGRGGTTSRSLHRLMSTRYSKGIYADPRWLALRDQAQEACWMHGVLIGRQVRRLRPHLPPDLPPPRAAPSWRYAVPGAGWRRHGVPALPRAGASGAQGPGAGREPAGVGPPATTRPTINQRERPSIGLLLSAVVGDRAPLRAC